jgi:replication initiation protein RepC
MDISAHTILLARRPRHQALNRLLIELGLIAVKDSPIGKRCGRRDREGRIVEAYGFDLSPLAQRIAAF